MLPKLLHPLGHLDLLPLGGKSLLVDLLRHMTSGANIAAQLVGDCALLLPLNGNLSAQITDLSRRASVALQ